MDASSFEPSGDCTIYAIHAPQNSKRLQAAVDEELKRVLKDGFSEEEVRDGATAMLNFRKLARSRDGTLASAWINYLQLDRTFDWSAQIENELPALTADQVKAPQRQRLDRPE